MAFASLPSLSASVLGKVYNVTDAFTTTSSFMEGSGKKYPAGTNVVVVDAGSRTYKFDVLAGFVDLSGYATTSAMTSAIHLFGQFQHRYQVGQLPQVGRARAHDLRGNPGHF